MINLVKYREYWESVAARVDEIAGVLPVTIDKEMGRKIQALPADSMTLFVFPPLAEGSGRNTDAFRESNNCVVFVMQKYNPQQRSAFSLLEETQPVVERVKSMLLADQSAPCSLFDVEMSSVETAPETELYGSFAGWSIAFNAKSS